MRVACANWLWTTSSEEAEEERAEDCVANVRRRRSEVSVALMLFELETDHAIVSGTGGGRWWVRVFEASLE